MAKADMKSQQEIAKMASAMLDAIAKDVCTNGCMDKPPGLYCNMCRSLNDKATALRWVLGLERNP